MSFQTSAGHPRLGCVLCVGEQSTPSSYHRVGEVGKHLWVPAAHSLLQQGVQTHVQVTSEGHEMDSLGDICSLHPLVSSLPVRV